MRVNCYNLEVPNILVKERGFNYDVDFTCFTSSDKIVDMLNTVFRHNKNAEEVIYMLAFNAKMKLLGVFEVFRGTVDSSFFSPREILIRGLLIGATSLILSHNHPSGIATPSREDIETTKKFDIASKIIGLNFADHLIIGKDDYYSFREKGFFK